MNKSKRFELNKNNTSKIPQKIFLWILSILISILSILAIFYIIQHVTPKEIDTNSSETSTIEITKKIIGLEDIEISKMHIKNSTTSSIIEISFKNISNTRINSCKISLYLLDKNENIIFGTSLNLPNMETNSLETFSVLSSSNITNVADYKVVLDK